MIKNKGETVIRIERCDLWFDEDNQTEVKALDEEEFEKLEIEVAGLIEVILSTLIKTALEEIK